MRPTRTRPPPAVRMGALGVPARHGAMEPLPLEAGLGFRLSRLARALRADWSAQLAELSLTPPQAAVLRGVAGLPGCSLRALARVLGAEPMTVKRCVDELEARGLLESAHRGEDRRPRGLALSPAGRLSAERIDTMVRRQEQELDAVLGPAARAGLDRALVALERLLGLHHAHPGSPDEGSAPDEAAGRCTPRPPAPPAAEVGTP